MGASPPAVGFMEPVIKLGPGGDFTTEWPHAQSKEAAVKDELTPAELATIAGKLRRHAKAIVDRDDADREWHAAVHAAESVSDCFDHAYVRVHEARKDAEASNDA